MIYSFETFSFDVGRRELHRNGARVAVEPQVFDLIHFLIRNRDRVVTRDDLVMNVWGGRAISDSALTSRIAVARQALGDSGEEQRLIRTIARKGVRFVGQVSEGTAVNKEISPGAGRQVSPAVDSNKRGTIMIVDGHALIREALRGVLGELGRGAQLIEASDARQAFEYIDRNPEIELILIDLNLPDRSGFEVLTELRGKYPAIAIVILSATDAHDDVTRAIDLGALGFIPKSTAREVMLGALNLIFAGGTYAPPELLARHTRLADKPSIAVLPFVNLSNDPGQDYFVEGMMDEIVTALTRIRALFVISSESSLALKGQALPDQHVAAVRMGVRYILEGSVRRSGNRIRIAAKLVDTSQEAQIWAERFDETLLDTFELQDRIALRVAGIIEPSVYEAEVRRVARRPIENLSCYDLYLRAAPLRAACRKAEVMQALKLLDRALTLDPDFAPALAQAAGCHSQMFSNSWGSDREWHRLQGLSLAERAIKAGSGDASVLAQAANAVMELDFDIVRAVALADRATTLNPGCARAWFISGLLRLIEADGDRAVEYLQTAARLDPLSPFNDIIRVHIAIGRFVQGDLPNALHLIRATTHRTARIHLFMAALYGQLDMPVESRHELAQFHSQSSATVEDMIAAMSPDAGLRAFMREGIVVGRERSVEKS